jgi:hypothetical protein
MLKFLRLLLPVLLSLAGLSAFLGLGWQLWPVTKDVMAGPVSALMRILGF